MQVKSQNRTKRLVKRIIIVEKVWKSFKIFLVLLIQHTSE